MRDSLHLLNSDSEQNISVPERKPIRTHRFECRIVVPAFPLTSFTLLCFLPVNLVSSVQVLRNLKNVERRSRFFRLGDYTTIESDR